MIQRWRQGLLRPRGLAGNQRSFCWVWLNHLSWHIVFEVQGKHNMYDIMYVSRHVCFQCCEGF